MIYLDPRLYDSTATCYFSLWFSLHIWLMAVCQYIFSALFGVRLYFKLCNSPPIFIWELSLHVQLWAARQCDYSYVGRKKPGVEGVEFNPEDMHHFIPPLSMLPSVNYIQIENPLPTSFCWFCGQWWSCNVEIVTISDGLCRGEDNHLQKTTSVGWSM